ncbi:hypothetical protein [Clostridium thermosuccinogenes]|uniref:hypothetical protein n=1 Tax=Clostridium thermosuccinogenes TaxID=84032 RepID=UPI000CCC58B8|nr:hypothetical protein [Pseudoclostridium thermosuccinogenes]PNT90244.1 hypothetical protein CDQ83_20005 [Pseudoclostridium thermosuccinogenes]
MTINIGNNNVLQGNINIGDNAMQVAKDFNQVFNSIDKLLELLKVDIVKHYNRDDKNEILKIFDEFKYEIAKPSEQRNNGLIKDKLDILSKAFSFVANSSSIAGLIATLYQILSGNNC